MTNRSDTEANRRLRICVKSTRMASYRSGPGSAPVHCVEMDHLFQSNGVPGFTRGRPAKSSADAAMSKRQKARQRVNPGLDARLGSLLRQRRHELGLSQSDLGKKLDLTFQQIQKYENGTNQLSVSRLIQICRVLKTPIEYFFAPRAALFHFEPIDYRLMRTLD